MRLTLRLRALALLVIVLGPAALASAGDRDRLIVREARVRPGAQGACRLELYVSVKPGLWPPLDPVAISISGIELVGKSAQRTRRGGDVGNSPRWRFRIPGRAVAELDVNRGIVRVRAHGIDFTSLAATGPADVPVAVKLGTALASTGIKFRETKSVWRFSSAPDAVVPDGASPPYRIVAGPFANIAGVGAVVARTPRELRAMLPDEPFLPAVDFAQETVVAVGLAHDVGSCWIPSFEITGAERTGDDIVVNLSVHEPTPLACSDAYVFYDVGVCVAVPRTSGRVSILVTSTR